MAKVDAKGRSKGALKHVRLHEWLLRSDAYRSLDCYAKCLLVELYRRYNGINNGEIGCSVREAAKLISASVNTARKAFEQIQDRGFARIYEKGHFRVKVRHSTTWILTEFSYAGRAPTKDFMTWKIQNTVSVSDTHSISTRYRKPKTTLQKGGNGITPGYRQRETDGATVSPNDTHLVNQGGVGTRGDT